MPATTRNCIAPATKGQCWDSWSLQMLQQYGQWRASLLLEQENHLRGVLCAGLNLGGDGCGPGLYLKEIGHFPLSKTGCQLFLHLILRSLPAPHCPPQEKQNFSLVLGQSWLYLEYRSWHSHSRRALTFPDSSTVPLPPNTLTFKGTFFSQPLVTNIINDLL